MTKPVLQKIYVILDGQDKGQAESLPRTLASLLSHVNLTSNICLVTGNLPQDMPQVDPIVKEASGFLRQCFFARLYVHIVHPASQATAKEIRLCYQYLKRTAREFDREGYMHQEVPRLMLLPVIVPDEQAEPASLIRLLDSLKGSFLLPSLFLDKDTMFLTQDEELVAKAEKVHYASGNSTGTSEMVFNLYCQDILDDLTAGLDSNTTFVADQCPAALIVSAPDGMIYACVETFRKREALADLGEKLTVDKVMDRYYQHGRMNKDCLACKKQVVDSFLNLPLTETTGHEIGALFYRFGTLYQDEENHVHAVESYKKSLNLSPAEEAGPVYFRLGISLTKTGHYDQAIEALKRAEPTCHDQYYFHFYMGFCYFEKGEYRKALEKFSESLRMKPQHEDLVRILIYMGTCHNNLGEYKAAIAQLEEAKEEALHVKETYSALGFSYFQLKDYEKAVENLTRAVKLDPHSAIDYASLGANYRDMGDISAALAMYEKALELDSTLAAARENLERLRKKNTK
jgi:tetratricopeptide (TPR) repeat protein